MKCFLRGRFQCTIKVLLGSETAAGQISEVLQSVKNFQKVFFWFEWDQQVTETLRISSKISVIGKYFWSVNKFFRYSSEYFFNFKQEFKKMNLMVKNELIQAQPTFVPI